jgi:hypothetical protein
LLLRASWWPSPALPLPAGPYRQCVVYTTAQLGMGRRWGRGGGVPADGGFFGDLVLFSLSQQIAFCATSAPSTKYTPNHNITARSATRSSESNATFMILFPSTHPTTTGMSPPAVTSLPLPSLTPGATHLGGAATRRLLLCCLLFGSRCHF